jgi:hypothetical protein
VFNTIVSGNGFEFAIEFVFADALIIPPTLTTPSAPLFTPPGPPSMPIPLAMTSKTTSTHTKSASLTQWFKPAESKERIKADCERMEAEHQATMSKWSEQDESIKAQKRKQQTEHARERQAKKRQHDKDADIEAGRRNLDGTIVKASPSLASVLSYPPPSSLNVAEASRPKRSLHEQERQNRGKGGRPRVNIYEPASLTNWMSPLLWAHIERAANRCRPQMSPAKICHELKKIDTVLFKALHPQTLRKWIDTKGEFPKWSARTMERVAAGYSPGGLTTRVGILVCFSSFIARPFSNRLAKCRSTTLK